MANLLLSPENFRTTWTSSNVRNNDDILDTATAPDNTVTADNLLDNSATGTLPIYFNQAYTLDGSSSYAYAIFLKADQLDWAWMWFDVGATTDTCFFDLTNGVKGTEGGAPDSTSIEDIGNGWYRCSIVATSDGAAGRVRVYAASADSVINVDLDGTSSIFVWGASLNTGTSADPYTSVAGITIGASADRGAFSVTNPVTRNITRGVTEGW